VHHALRLGVIPSPRRFRLNGKVFGERRTPTPLLPSPSSYRLHIAMEFLSLVAIIALCVQVVSAQGYPGCASGCPGEFCPTFNLTCVCDTHAYDITSCFNYHCSGPDLTQAYSAYSAECPNGSKFPSPSTQELALTHIAVTATGTHTLGLFASATSSISITSSHSSPVTVASISESVLTSESGTAASAASASSTTSASGTAVVAKPSSMASNNFHVDGGITVLLALAFALTVALAGAVFD
jgi:hypothetical protein